MNRKSYSELDDEALVRLTLNGEREAFSELIIRYQGRALGVVTGVVGNREDALDVVQDAFMKAYTSLGSFRFGSKFYTWFYRLLVNRAIDKLREISRNPGASYDETWMKEDGLASPVYSEYTDGPERLVQRKELKESIKEAIDSLSENHRVVIVLRELEGLSYEEIAGILGISIGTVMSRIYYAREKLRALLKNHMRDI
jgi:RNA polymerase sigma-70 factor (ECF subfamily)